MKTDLNRAPLLKVLPILLCLAAADPAFTQPQEKKTVETAASSTAPIIISGLECELREGDIEVYSKITGIATAQDTYDIFAPFDGRVEEVMAELFDLVTPEKAAARLVSTEMAALLDSTIPDAKNQTERRWQDVYDYYELKPQQQGILANIYVKSRSRIRKGDRLFTVARKVVIVGKNSEPLYSQIAPGMTAEMQHIKSPYVRVKAALTSFIPEKGDPLNARLWLEALDLHDGIMIGERFNGYLFVGRSENARLAPRTALVEKNGRKYIMLEVKTGLSTEFETELLESGLHFLIPYSSAEQTYGKNKKVK